IDFTGGTSILLKVDALSNEYVVAKKTHQSINAINVNMIKKIREILEQDGFSKSTIQITSNKEIIIRTTTLTKESRSRLLEILQQKLGNLELLESDTIGPSFGTELREKSLWILILVFVALMIYITWRFEFSFGMGALISLVHDAIATICFASIFFIEIDTSFVAAILTILGYSINDTIVIFDRVRENLKTSKKEDFIKLVNISIYQTFSRTINTVITVLLVLLALMVFGGTTIKGFTIVLFFGVIIGTYSSIFIASVSMVLFNNFATKQAIIKQEINNNLKKKKK
ncbi:MAG: protein translocase subunit SecF, partial [Candidatus Margulisiibacteriota bacterium]